MRIESFLPVRGHQGARDIDFDANPPKAIYGHLPNVLIMRFQAQVIGEPGDAEGDQTIRLKATDPQGGPSIRGVHQNFPSFREGFTSTDFVFDVIAELRTSGLYEFVLSLDGIAASKKWRLFIEHNPAQDREGRLSGPK